MRNGMPNEKHGFKAHAAWAAEVVGMVSGRLSPHVRVIVHANQLEVVPESLLWRTSTMRILAWSGLASLDLSA